MTELAPRSPSTRLRVVYRSHGGENSKSRPSYYSKRLALLSLVRAVEAVDVDHEIHYLNDGEIPPPRLSVMQRTGQVHAIDGGSNRRSYRTALAFAAERWGYPDELVWFAEDDYLYAEDAFVTLIQAVAALRDTQYFGMYGLHAIKRGVARPRRRPLELLGAGGDPEAVAIGGVRWFRMMSTTSTYGVRADILREDLRTLRFTPYTGGAFDMTTCMTVQGLRPFTWGEVREDLLPLGVAPQRWPRQIFRGTTRGVSNMLARRPAERRRVMHGADPELACHLEEGNMAMGLDWYEVAGKTAAWAVNEGYGVIDLEASAH